jgi:hypothetical protein
LRSATITANAVERMRNKCEQKTTTAVSQATFQLNRDLKMSQRLGSALQSKLTRVEVYAALPLSLFLSILYFLTFFLLQVSNAHLASSLSLRLDKIKQLETTLKKVSRHPFR